MDPAIKYVTASDGVNLAYCTLGEGPPLAFLPVLPLSHLQIEGQIPSFRSFVEWFGLGHQVVRYDARGMGLSDSRVADRSLDAHVDDLLTILDRLGIENASLFAASYSGPIALAFAARYPERVSRLILWCSHACYADVWRRITPVQREQREAVIKLAAVDWSLAIHTYIHHAFGWAAGDDAYHYAHLAIKSMEPTRFFSALDTFAGFDATAELPRITAPTLVLHRPDFPASDVDVARGLAARIPNSRLALLEGRSVLPFDGDYDGLLQVIAEFLGPHQPAKRLGSPSGSPGSPAPGAGLRTIFFTDIESHTAMMQRLGDERGRAILREHERITRKALRDHAGSEVKSLGDGFLASFVSAQNALECAIDLQRAMAQVGVGSGQPLRIRIGINAGEPIAEEDDLFGASVIAASRIASSARGGEILVANVVRELVAGKGFLFASRGDVALRGLDDPVHVYELRWQESGVPG